MKMALFLCGLALAATAEAQTTNAPVLSSQNTLKPTPTVVATQLPTNSIAPQFPPVFQSRASGEPVLTTAPVFSLKQEAPNEIIRSNISYSGIAVEVVKTKRPLQLLNPLAPPEYGTPEDNLARDSINQRPTGLKLFAIHF